MMPRKLKLGMIFILMIAVLMNFAFVGCKPTESGDSEQSEQTEEVKDFSGVQLRVAAYRNLKTDSLNMSYGLGGDEFLKKYPGSNIEYMTAGSTGGAQELVAAVTSGDPWNLQLTIGPAIPNIFKEGLYEPLDDLVDENNPIYSKVTLDTVKWDGKLYGINNVMMNDFYYLVYNESMLKDYGIKTPYEYYEEGAWNWESFLKLIDDLNQNNIACEIFYDKPILSRYSHTWNDDGTIEITYDSKENQEWLEFIRTLMYEKKVPHGRRSNVQKRATAFKVDILPDILIQTINEPTEDVIRYIPFPEKDGSITTYMVDYSFSIPKGAKDKEAAIELANYMIKSRTEYMENLYKENMLPEDYEIFKKALENGYVVRAVVWGKGFNELKTEFPAGKPVSTAISEVIDSMKAAAEKWNNEIKGNQ